MNKEDLKVKSYHLKFADGRLYSFPYVNDLQAKFYSRYLISSLFAGKPKSFKFFKGGFVMLFVDKKINNKLQLEFIAKVYPFKRKYFKAVNLWSGKRSFVPVTSLHVVHCAICKYFTDDFAGVCNRCQGCLDCRGTYYRPIIESVSFVDLLDRFDKYNDLPF